MMPVECYVEPEEIAEHELLLDANMTAEMIADLISAFTHNEVDGDGDPWSIVCGHLDGLLDIFRDVCDRFPVVAHYLLDEYGIDRCAK